MFRIDVPTPGSGKSLLHRVEDSLLPLINLVFLLLMFFLVTGQVTESPLPRLPGLASTQNPQAPDADLVVEAHNQWRVNAQLVTRQTLLSALPPPDTDQPLKIAADKSTTMAELEALFRLLEGGGFKDVILLTEPVL
ncbi:biopolymer transporter ExbD [Marinobacter caseinilyticus]|uniref:biopolymer transporter ExbD n=1 Tax=Marinobacter caseinilyticus TaxID=2692195 RepID=UPI00140D2A2C|nr:biopolymer transporter ExbD [Marinobacter caseinilyticus]